MNVQQTIICIIDQKRLFDHQNISYTGTGREIHMKNRLAFIMTLSLLLTSISPVNAIGAEVIETAKEENPSVYFTEDEEDPELEIVEDPETVPEADIVEEDGADEEIFTEELIASDIFDLIEEEDPENGTICEVYTSGPVSVGDAGDGRGRAGYGESVLSAASEPDGSEYYGSQLSETQKAIYELLKGGNWQYCEPDDSDEGHYTVPYPAGTDYSFVLDHADFQSSDEYQSICQRLSTDIYSAFDAYLYDYPEESFWIRSSGMGWSISRSQDYSTGLYHFSLIKIGLNAYERWTGAIGRVAQLKTYTDNSAAQIQAVDGYAAMTSGEKLKAVHDHICRLVSYGDASNVVEAQHTPYGAYDSQHKVVCEGYAKLFKILTDKLGIADNALVSGMAISSNGSGGAHMWNAVSLNGSWYLLDATWDDQDNTSMVYYDYFLAGSGSYGFSSSMTVGEQHEAQAYLSDYGDAFITPLLSGTMYHQRKQTNATATCTEAGSTTVVCGLHPVMAEGTEADTETVTIPATGHSWALSGWQWNADNTSVTATFTCMNDSSHSTSISAQPTSVTTDATCTETGQTVYTAEVSLEGNPYTDEKTVQIPALGHDWRGPYWAWPTNAQADARFMCRNNSLHTEHVFATATPEVISQATCETNGQVVYTAVIEFEGNTYTGKNPITIPMTGHRWGETEYTWADDNSEVTAVRICQNDNSHRLTRTVQTTSEQTKAPTCTEKGESTYTAVFNNGFATQIKTVADIDSTGHDYGDPVWEWADDYSSATVTLTCKNNPAHIEELAGTITSVISKNATYAETGEKTYTAAAECEGKEYQDHKTEEIPKLSPNGVTENGLSGDVADGVLTISLQEDTQSAEIPDYASSDAAPWMEAAKELNVSKIVVAEGITKIGSNAFAGLPGLEVLDLPRSLEELAGDSVDENVLTTIRVNYAGTESEWEVLTQGTAFQDVNMTATHTHIWGDWTLKTAADCTEDEVWERECEICHNTETQTKEGTATGHDWHADWTWTGTVRARVHFHCENNHDHYDNRDAAITSVTTPATCEENGKTVYTATVTFDGTVYTDTKTVTIQKTGHNYDDPAPVWSWADDYSSATVTLTCQNDPAHTKELAGTITSVITSNPTYTEAGEKTHTAVAEYEGRGYQDQKTEEIPKLSPDGVTENGLSWKITGGVLTISPQEDVQSAVIPDYASLDDAPWMEAAKELNVSKIVVAEGITGIGSNAFTGLENVSEIDLPRSLTELADDSMDGSVLSTINVNYAGTESEWAALTQGTAYEGTPMTSAHTHTWNTGTVTKPATTTDAGIRTYTCSVCGEIKTESIPCLKTKPVVTKPVETEKITITKKPSIKKQIAAKNKITVNWKHFKHTSKKTKPIWNKIKKVQVQCAADSGFKNNVRTAIVGKKKTKATIKGLARKTTYYVRVRYYDGTGYSAWSKAKKVKTK